MRALIKNTSDKPKAARARLPEIPVFSLYGEAVAQPDAEFLHIEDIRSRSERYDWQIGSHKHLGLFQVIVLLEGGADVHMDGRAGTVQAQAALTIPPASVHAFRFQPGTKGHVLTLAEAMLLHGSHMRDQPLIAHLFEQPSIIDFAAVPQHAERIDALLMQIADEFRDAAPGRALMQEWLVAAVLMLIARQRVSDVQGAHYDRQQIELFNRFRTLIEKHYLEHWAVPRYAASLRVTESKLNRVCQAISGKTAFDLVRDRLVLEARRKLIYIAAPVSLLAYELGFEDPAYFWRFFRKQTGLTPAAFRRQQRGLATGRTR